MPAPYFRTETETINKAALASMQAGRASKGKGARRAIRRSWTYGGGKKTAAKLAVGVGFGAVFLGASIATAGAAAGVIAALAVGSWVVGQMTDAGFSKLAGKKYRGGEATNKWVEEYTKPDTQEKAKALDERAHKTVRRAFEHYRRAVDKAVQSRPLVQACTNANAGCDDAVELAMGLMSITRHLEKTRIYLHPGLFLSQWVLEAYRSYLKTWQGSGQGTSVTEKVNAKIKELMEGHQGPCESEHCFFESTAGNWNPGARPTLWAVDGEPVQLFAALTEAQNKLSLCTVVHAPGNASLATRRLYLDAGSKYERRSVAIKVKHSFTNAWRRKTKSEQKAYVGTQILGAGLSAGAGGVSGGLNAANINLAAGWEVLIEFGFQLTGNSLATVIDEGSSETEASKPTIDRQKAGSKAGSDAQDYLRKAAIHMWEAAKITEALKTAPGAVDCDTAVARLREIYKIEHHLGKTQKYLGDAVAFVVLLTNNLEAKITASNAIHARAFTLIDRIMTSHDHTNCGKVCYDANPPRRLT